jgi:hypothetical protein
VNYVCHLRRVFKDLLNRMRARPVTLALFGTNSDQINLAGGRACRLSGPFKGSKKEPPLL